MAKKGAFNPEDIKLLKIGIFKSNYQVDFHLADILKQFKGYRFCVGQNTSVNLKEQAVRIRLNVSITAQGKKNEELPVHGDFAVEFHYRIENFKNYTIVDSKKKSLFLPEMGATILGITYSTVRGIIFTKTANSVLPSVVLPVINPKNLFQGDFIFEN